MSENNKNTKTIFFGLTTESVHLYHYYLSNEIEDIFIYSNKENSFVTGNIEEGVVLLKSDKTIKRLFCCYNKLPIKIAQEIIQYCHSNQITLYLFLNENENHVKNYIPSVINGIIVFQVAAKPLRKKVNIFLKRCFDFIFSLFVIIFVLSWLFPVLALLIRIESKGSILFIQKRNGLYNQEFKCLKFRTMHLNDQCNDKQAVEGDCRITKIGRFLRRTSIDEFPQFFNVFVGSMSVVGPRPHMIKHNEMYVELIDNYNQRTYTKPGITGLAQVLGYRGETESDLFLMKIRVRMDIFYINNWSFLLDIKIVLKTILNVFIPNKNAF